MKKAILGAYAFLSSHRPLVWMLLALIVGLSLFSASRMSYQEDIAAFLPRDAQAERYAGIYAKLGGQDRIALFFENKDKSGDTWSIIEAMDCFSVNWRECDSPDRLPEIRVSADNALIDDVFAFISGNEPYFLTGSDYERMDSLLAQPGFVGARLDELKAALYSPASSLAPVLHRSDPLGLFSPVLSKLGELNPAASVHMEDGYLFTQDGKAGVVFFDSPFGGSESAGNAWLAEVLQDAVSRTMNDCPGIRIFSTGGPLVAVENASRIRKDSFLAVSIALLLIALVLYFSFRRFQDVLWTGITIIFGAVSAVGVLALFKSTMSIIVLGIGSMIIGIAVNYPLHYVDHLKFTRDRRKSLADQINPLLVGNVTTVSAFLSLFLLKADALHDFGAIGALMLAGTILFVLFFLPVLVPDAPGERRTVMLDWDRHLNPSAAVRKIVFAVFLVLTAVFLFLSRKISFDPDMGHINYMTDEQRRGFALLEEMSEDEQGLETLYAVSEATALDELAQLNERLLESIGSVSVRSLSPFLPSMAVQAERLARWTRFRDEHADLAAELKREAAARGFAAGAFAPFLALLEKEWKVQDLSYFETLSESLGASMLLKSDGKAQMVNYIRLDKSRADSFKAELRAVMPESCFCFNSSDVGTRLVAALSEDFDRIGLICSIIVLIFLCLSFRSLELGLSSFLPLATGWIWILGMMHLSGLQFNIVNIILATFIFGQGDDYTVFIMEGLMYEHACGKKILRSYKNCVMLSAIIMLIGIGSLAVARHPAMRSLAYVTVIGMSTVVVMAYYLPPLVFRWLTRKKDGTLRPVPLTFRNIAATIWISLCFGVAMVLMSVWASLYFLAGKDTERKRLRYHRLIRSLSSAAIRSVPGVRYTFSNPHGEDFSKPAIYICNHQSHIDVLALLALQPKIVFMTNDWAWKFYGKVIRKAEFYPASFGLAKNSEHMKSLMERGYSVAIFPEGTRSADCCVQRFHRGAFLAARELGLDILPLYIHGFGYALPKHDFVLRKAGLYMEVGKRLPASSLPEDLRSFVKEYRKEFSAEYERIRRERETAAYNAPYVKYQYLYKGVDAMRECASVLKRSTFEEIDALSDNIRTVSVSGSGYGVYALLLALTHRDKEIFAYEPDEEKFLTAARCQAVPPNLHYFNTAGNGREPADLEICL